MEKNKLTPTFGVGDYLKCKTSGSHWIITETNDPEVIMMKSTMNRDWSSMVRHSQINEIFQKAQPSEVIFGFGSGIEGTVEPLQCECCKDKVFILRISKERFIEIPLDILTEPVRTDIITVLKLIQRSFK